MPNTKPKRYDNIEPADRPFNMQLSGAELISLVDYHMREMKKIEKKLGKFILSRDLAQKEKSKLWGIAEQLVHAHGDRAKYINKHLQ